MPFQIISIKDLTGLFPDDEFDPARDRLQIEFANGESVILMYENRSPYIKNPLFKSEHFWLDHCRSPLNFSADLRAQLAPRPDEWHSGWCASLVTGHLFLRMVSQTYLGRFRSESYVTMVKSVRTTEHTSFTYEEIQRFEPSVAARSTLSV